MEISGATKSVIVERTNDFGVRLFHSYSSNNSSNIIISPLNCAYAMSMLSLGANGETYDEIVNTLGLTGKDKQALGAFYKSISEDLIQADDAVSFETANSIWLGENITIKPSYSENALYYYNAQAHNVDFNSPATVKIINGWISEKTQGLIQNMISNTDGWIVALINALYFKSAWSETMSAGCMSFNTVDGKTIKESAVISDKFSLYEGSEGQYISMDFGGEGNFIFELMIPKDNISTASEITVIS